MAEPPKRPVPEASPKAPQKPIVIEKQGPLIITTFWGKATDAEYAAYLDEMTAIIERTRHQPQRQVVINDTTRWLNSNAVQRRMQADWMLKYDAEMRFKTAGVAFVITSSLVRAGLNAIFWFAPLPCPHKIVATLEEAVAWAEEALKADAPRSSSSAGG